MNQGWAFGRTLGKGWEAGGAGQKPLCVEVGRERMPTGREEKPRLGHVRRYLDPAGSSWAEAEGVGARKAGPSGVLLGKVEGSREAAGEESWQEHSCERGE